MSQRLPTLFNTSIKTGIRSGARQQRSNTTIRSYATHQEQDAKTPSSSTPLILAGILALGGYVYYSNNKGNGSKQSDPSDVSGQQFQKKADQEIAQRTDGQNSVNIRDRSPSAIQNETKELSGHPVATKKDAYVDPSTEKKQTASGSDSSALSSLSDLKEGAQEGWDKVKQEAERTMRSWEREAKTATDSDLDAAKKSVDSVVDSLEQSAVNAKNKAQATWDQVTTTASDRADETKQAVSNTKDELGSLSSNGSDLVEHAKDQANALWNQVSGDAREKMDEAEGQVKDAEQKAREKAGDIKDSISR